MPTAVSEKIIKYSYRQMDNKVVFFIEVLTYYFSERGPWRPSFTFSDLDQRWKHDHVINRTVHLVQRYQRATYDYHRNHLHTVDVAA